MRHDTYILKDFEEDFEKFKNLYGKKTSEVICSLIRKHLGSDFIDPNIIHLKYVESDIRKTTEDVVSELGMDLGKRNVLKYDFTIPEQFEDDFMKFKKRFQNRTDEVLCDLILNHMRNDPMFDYLYKSNEKIIKDVKKALEGFIEKKIERKTRLEKFNDEKDSMVTQLNNSMIELLDADLEELESIKKLLELLDTK